MLRQTTGGYGYPAAHRSLPSTLAYARAGHGRLYRRILNILGPTGIIVPIADANHENAGRTYCAPRGKEEATFTYSEAITAFDTPPTVQGPGRIPIITFNGTDEEADTPDAAYWSRDDAGGANGFSIGLWVNVTDTGDLRDFLGKWDASAGAELRQWLFYVRADDKLQLLLWDESTNVSTSRTSSAAITMGSMRFFVVTYDGAGGASAGDTVALYDNGAVLASAGVNNAAYAGMENSTTKPTLGFNAGPSGDINFFKGEMAGGPCGPFFVQRELTAGEVSDLHQLGEGALGL